MIVTSTDRLPERSVGRGMNGVTFGPHTGLDYGDVSLLVKLLELLVIVLQVFQDEAAPFQ